MMESPAGARRGCAGCDVVRAKGMRRLTGPARRHRVDDEARTVGAAAGAGSCARLRPPALRRQLGGMPRAIARADRAAPTRDPPTAGACQAFSSFFWRAAATKPARRSASAAQARRPERGDAIEARPAAAGLGSGRRVDFDDQPFVGEPGEVAVEHARPELHPAAGALEHVVHDAEAVPILVGQREQDLEPVRRQAGRAVAIRGIYLQVYTWEVKRGARRSSGRGRGARCEGANASTSSSARKTQNPNPVKPRVDRIHAHRLARRDRRTRRARSVSSPTPATTESVSGSAGATPNSIVWNVRMSSTPPVRPIASPMSAWIVPSRRTRRHHVCRRRAERHAHADLRRPQRDQMRHHAVDAGGGEHQRQAAEHGEQQHAARAATPPTPPRRPPSSARRASGRLGSIARTRSRSAGASDAGSPSAAMTKVTARDSDCGSGR